MKRIKVWSIFVLLALALTPPIWAEEKEDSKSAEDKEKDKDGDENPKADASAGIDYTKVKTPPGNLQWVFGPTGLYGWTDRGSKQIYVKDVDANSPASTVMQKGDVILGIVSPKKAAADASVSKLFTTSDTRREFAEAITEAEKAENRGRLVLNVWRNGKTFEAAINIRVMGSYSETAPAKCPKTAQIIALACNEIKERGLKGGISGCLDALGLLSTGRPEYLPLVKALAHKIGKPSTELGDGGGSWGWGYTNLFLTEYYLATKDDYVLPAIKEYAESIALGQGQCGLWSHGTAPIIKTPTGVTNGILEAYGAMNSASLPCAISLVLAQKCGIKSERVDHAVKKFANHLRWYVDKGAIPYGDHDPGIKHAANGKNAMAAVFFDVLGDEASALYFARCSIASYNEVEGGHTGNYWSFAWSALGAGCAGEEAAAAFMREIRWYHELERRWDGGIRYQGQMSARDHLKYGNWSLAGARLMHYTLSNRALQITGKGGRSVKPIVGQDLDEVLAAGRGNILDGLDTAGLLKMLGSWSPVVRHKAARAIGGKDENVVPQLIAMLQGPDRYARYGACNALRHAGRQDDAAADLVMKAIQQSDDPTLQYNAAYVFSERGPNTMSRKRGRLGPVLLAHAAKLQPSDKMLNTISNVLFYFGSEDIWSVYPFGKDLDKIDKNILIPGLKSLLRCTNGGARGNVARAVYGKLSDDDLKLLWGDIYLASRDRSPSNIMFQDGVRVAGLNLMAKHGIKEGIDVGLNLIQENRWGKAGRVSAGIPALVPYGGAIKDKKSVLASTIDARFKKDSEESKALHEALKALDTAPTPKLVSIEAAIKAAEAENAKAKAADAEMVKAALAATVGKTPSVASPKVVSASPSHAVTTPAAVAPPKAATLPAVPPAILANWHKRFIKKLNELASGGKKLKFQDGKQQTCIVRSADEKSLTVDVQGNPLPMPWSWVSADQRADLARSAVSDEDVESLLIAAVMTLAVNRNELADTYLTKAELKDPEAAKSLRMELSSK